MVPRDTRLKKLQLVIDEQSPMRIKPDSLTFLVKRKKQEHYVLLNRRQMLRGRHTTRHTFHSEIGAQSVLRVADEVLRTNGLLRTTRRILCRSSRRILCVISFMCARKSGYEDLTKEILRHFEAHGFLNPIIIQCDKEMSIIDLCRKVARERNWRTALIFAPKTSHQSNGFVEAVHGHIQGLARCYQTQIETNSGMRLSAIPPAIPFAVRHAGFVSQDSNVCSELHMCHLCACLVNRYSRLSPIMQCEQPS